MLLKDVCSTERKVSISEVVKKRFASPRTNMDKENNVPMHKERACGTSQVGKGALNAEDLLLTYAFIIKSVCYHMMLVLLHKGKNLASDRSEGPWWNG